MRIFKKKMFVLKERQPRQDLGKVVFNFSNISLSEAEKSLLVKGLKFSIPPKELADYTLFFIRTSKILLRFNVLIFLPDLSFKCSYSCS